MNPDKEKQPASDASGGRQWLVLLLIAAPVIALIAYGVFLDLGGSRPDPSEPFVKPWTPPPVPPLESASLPTPPPPPVNPTSERIKAPEFHPDPTADGRGSPEPQILFLTANTNRFDPNIQVRYYWDRFPESLAKPSLPVDEKHQNITRADYAGPESCKECHKDNYNDWLTHAHRSMNAVASDATVKANFSGDLSLNYLGGQARFHREDDERRMTLSRDGTNRTYAVKRTLGSRFFQYYVGLLIDGPEPQTHVARTKEQLLPVGYWIDEQTITPVVHVHGEAPDGQRYDPFSGPTGTIYNHECAICHTTMPAGDWMLHYAGSSRLQDFTPRQMSFFASEYLAGAHPELVIPERPGSFATMNEIQKILLRSINDEIKPEKAVTLGISCESCHMGCLEHTKNEKQKPRFYLSSPLVHIPDNDTNEVFGKTDANRNWVCSRCHSGGRTTYAGGMDHWNSTEYSDAIKGFCYDPKKASERGLHSLTCVHCHDPHQGIGRKWPLTPKQDDAKCMDCHEQFKTPAKLAAHTHHPTDSPGSRCMNCHMPKINEGLQDMVRTHVIFNPTNRKMIEANQPNACNLCHVDKPIDWTISRLREWYGEENEYAEAEIARHYPNRQGPAGPGYLKSHEEAVRLAASEAMFKRQARWAIPELIEMLSDPYLLNRQFTQKNFDREFGVDPKKFGYRFTMTPEERKAPIQRMREALRKTAENKPVRQ